MASGAVALGCVIATSAWAGSSSSAISEAWVNAASSASPGALPSPATRSAPIVPPDLDPVAVATPAGGLSDPASSPSADPAASPSPADADNMVDTPADLNSGPPSTAEIPPVVPPTVTTAMPPPPSAPPTTTSVTSATDPLATAPTVTTGQQQDNQAEIARYEAEQSGYSNPQQLQNLSQYMSQDSVDSPIGFELREARRKLSSGEEADGLLIVDVKKGSAAALAGLHGYSRGAHNVLTGAAIVGSMFFPPVILLVPAIDYTQIGESYDMIIGVDGSRVANFLDFEDRTRDLQPGELIYLSIVRNGRRMQISIPVPPNFASATY
jgi:hypothetical protein